MSTIDRVSLLVELDGATTLEEAERELRAQALTLDVAPNTLTVAEWLAHGARGVRDAWLDPADHLVAGIEATLTNGTKIRVHPAPRRAVGPDLIALFVGTQGRFGTIDRAWLRVHPVGVARPTTSAFKGEDDPAMTPEEEAIFATLERELARS